MVNALSENPNGKVRYDNWRSKAFSNAFEWSLEDYKAEGFQRTFVTNLFEKRVKAVSDVLDKFRNSDVLDKFLKSKKCMIGWENCSVWDFGAGPGSVSLGIVNFLRIVTSGHADPRVNLLDPVVEWEPCTRILENVAGIDHVNFHQHNSLRSMADALNDYESDEDELLILGLGHVVCDFGYQDFWTDLLKARRGRALLVVLLQRFRNWIDKDLPKAGFQVKYFRGFDEHSKENAAVLYAPKVVWQNGHKNSYILLYGGFLLILGYPHPWRIHGTVFFLHEGWNKYSR